MKMLLNISLIILVISSIYCEEFISGINSYREAKVYFNRAVRVKDFTKKEELYSQVLDFYKKQNPISYEDIVSVYTSMSIDYIEIEDFSKIKHVLNNLKKDAPSFYEEEKISIEIQINLQEGKYKEVLNLCDDLIDIKGDNPYSILFKGVSFMLMKDFKKAFDMFNHILMRAPLVKKEKLYRGICSTYLGNYNSALKDLNFYIAKTKSFELDTSLPYYYKAICLFKLGKFEKAKLNIAKGKAKNEINLGELSNRNDALFKERIEKEVAEIEVLIKEKNASKKANNR